jgi:hypothetical protein
MLSAVMLNVVMLSVVAPFCYICKLNLKNVCNIDLCQCHLGNNGFFLAESNMTNI